MARGTKPPNPSDINNLPDHGEFSGLDPHVQEKLGEMFQSFCEEMVNQPVPDRFMALLAQLKAKERDLK
jgi:hypothetical protein